MASVISAGTTSGTSLNLSGDTSGVLQLASNGSTTAVTIDTAQQIGVGTTSPSNFGNSNNRGITINGQGTAGFVEMQSSGTAYGITYANSSNLGLRTPTALPILFETNGANERMRILSGGNVCIGTTSNIARLGVLFDGNTDNGCVLRTSTNASGAGFLYFQQDTNTCGAVTRVGTTSAVTYATTSDYRLKENVLPMTDGLDKVSRLKPVTYTWKQGGESAEGFIAHELAEVCPDAVVGTKDQVETYLDEDGNEQTRPKYQSIDTSFLVATLTSAIQELNAKVEAQAVRIAELEGAK